METVAELIKAYRAVVINNLFISLLLIKLFSLFFIKPAYPVSKEIIRWLIIICAAASLLNWVLYMATNDPALPERATGNYWWAFWMLIFFSDIVPFVLMFKKLKNNIWAMLIVVLLMNFAKGMEWQAFSGTNGSGESAGISLTPFLTLFTGGTLLAIFITGISIVVMKYRKTGANDINAL